MLYSHLTFDIFSTKKEPPIINRRFYISELPRTGSLVRRLSSVQYKL